ncbi:5,10-methylene tetrahydromethanopterin reductase [Acinetobacter baumannii]
MTKKISFNAFEMNSIAHQSPGLWRHPQDRSVEYKDLEYWTDLAQILERGFLTVFLLQMCLVFMTFIIKVLNML